MIGRDDHADAGVGPPQFPVPRGHQEVRHRPNLVILILLVSVIRVKGDVSWKNPKKKGVFKFRHVL